VESEKKNILQPLCIFTCLVCLLSVLIFPQQTLCNDIQADKGLAPHITDISIVNDNTMLYVNFRLVDGFPAEVVDALKSGIPLTFLYDIVLEVPGTFMNTTVVSRTVKRKIKYDTIKGEYMVSFDPINHRVIMVNNEKDAIRLISTVNHIPLTALSSLTRNEIYRLKIRAGVEKEESSIAFTGILNIFSSWGYKTDWHEVVFNY